VKTRLPSLGAHDGVTKLQASARVIRNGPAQRSRIADCRYGTAFSHSLCPKRTNVAAKSEAGVGEVPGTSRWVDGPSPIGPRGRSATAAKRCAQLAPESEDAGGGRESPVAGPLAQPDLAATGANQEGAPRVRKPQSEDGGSARFAAFRVCGCVWPEEAALPLVREPPRRAGRGVVVSLPHAPTRDGRAGEGRGGARAGAAAKAARPHRAGTGRGSQNGAVSDAGRRRCCRPSNGRSGSPSPRRAPPRAAAAP
jgi:hypothetical protein